MGSEESKSLSAEGNSNNNEITVIEQIQEHGDATKVLLAIIIAILLINLLYKWYTIHRNNIKKNAIRKSRVTVDEI